jgi:drug/metabolite transporter (DMT)-like permease
MRLDRRDRSRMVALSFIWTAIPFTLFPLAEQHVNSAVAGLLNGSTPMFAALFAVGFFGRRTSGPQLLGLVVGFGGVVLISLPSLGEGSSQALGVLLVLIASACYGLAVNIAVPLQDRYGSRPVMARMLALATVWTLPFALVGLPSSDLELPSLAAVIVLGVVGTGLAYLLMGTLVSRVGPTRASFITYLIPVVSLVLGVVFRDDEVAPAALVGVALVLTGAVLAGRQERPAALAVD